jgi:hypothetical protein
MNFIFIGEGLDSIKESLDQYEVYKFLSIKNASIPIVPDARPAHEQYEEAATPDVLAEAFADLDGTESTAVMINASSDISGASLAILEHLSNVTNMTELFIYIPELTYLSKNKVLQSKIVFGVLQEYARSGMLPPVYLIDAARCERSLTDITLKNKSEKVGQFIANIVHNYYFAINASKIENLTIENSVTCVIGALGLMDFDSGDIFYTFPLSNFDGRCKFPLEANHHFFFTTETLENERITHQMKQLLDSRKDAYDTIGYSVIETEINQVVVVEKTSKIQTLEN